MKCCNNVTTSLFYGNNIAVNGFYCTALNSPSWTVDAVRGLVSLREVVELPNRAWVCGPTDGPRGAVVPHGTRLRVGGVDTAVHALRALDAGCHAFILGILAGRTRGRADSSLWAVVTWNNKMVILEKIDYKLPNNCSMYLSIFYLIKFFSMTITGNARVVLKSNYCPTAKQSCPYNQLLSYINQSTVLIIIQKSL